MLYQLTAAQQQIFRQELSTTRDVLRWMTTVFQKADLYFGHGTDNAWDEALSLLQFYLHLNEKELEICLAAKLTALELAEIWELILARVNLRKPLAYITQQIVFAGLNFYIDNRVLIPRSPFAELIQNDFQPAITDGKAFNKIMELGTGSGCIAAALASFYPHAEIWAIDNSDAALAVAELNFKNLGLSEQIKLIKSHWFSEVAKLNARDFDLIIANPPYVNLEIYENLPPEYQHEPRVALYAPEDGLADALEILEKAADFLNVDGYLFLEVGVARRALESRFPNVPFLWLDFVHGGEGILMLTADQLRQFNIHGYK